MKEKITAHFIVLIKRYENSRNSVLSFLVSNLIYIYIYSRLKSRFEFNTIALQFFAYIHG